MLEIVLPFCIFTVICLGFMTAFLVVRAKKGGCALAVVLKTVASIGFLAGGIYALSVNSGVFANLFIVLGLVFALVGDVVLDLKIAYKEDNKLYLNSGITSFTISSALYFVAMILLWHTLDKFLLLSVGSVVIALLFATIVFLLAKPLKLDFSGYKIQVFIYSFFVALVAIMGLGISITVPRFALFAVGALLVLVSDLVLSMMYFGGKGDSKVLCSINHILYYLGELFVMSYLFFQMF
ncbi:MAG: hypothetical protein IKC11_04400 [Clostridia bacterium]|nr:hypothetical protein [Clostridia bacterium]